MKILHEDQAIVVVAKPSGLVVHRNEWAPDASAVLQLARDATGGDHLYPVHRLDRGASGVLVLARSSGMARLLHEQLEDGRAEKRYLALVRGAPPESGSIDQPIPRREGGPRRPALAEYRCRGGRGLCLGGGNVEVRRWRRTGPSRRAERVASRSGRPPSPCSSSPSSSSESVTAAPASGRVSPAAPPTAPTRSRAAAPSATG